MVRAAAGVAEAAAALSNRWARSETDSSLSNHALRDLTRR
jgi:hypothetical protein